MRCYTSILQETKMKPHSHCCEIHHYTNLEVVETKILHRKKMFQACRTNSRISASLFSQHKLLQQKLPNHQSAQFLNYIQQKCYSTETRVGYLPEASEAQAKEISPEQLEVLSRVRNIGISAHIDSGKTTLTERILYYTGRINKIHEVKGGDGGAKMDSMELERERGITIQSAATFCRWNDHHINIIDTPGHVDFTVEVERALRVLDGAVLVLCGVSGVQSQSLTVDRQMKRYKVPRLCFINKLDRMGANHERVIAAVREKLGINCAFVQIPVGLEEHFNAIIDIIERKVYRFEGKNGEKIVISDDIPENQKKDVEEKRKELIEKLAEFDPKIEEYFLVDEEPPVQEIQLAIRRLTVTNKFAPVFVGSAKKNMGVQLLLNGVVKYLPNPAQIDNYAMDRNNNEEKVLVSADEKKPFVGLAFKLEDGKYGQLTYVRVYQGTLKKGDMIINTSSGQRVKLPRLVRMHANEMEEVNSIGPGEICALFGVECSSGDTFTNNPKVNVGMESMYVPEPVVSLSIKVADKTKENQLAKALNKFTREDPTFKVHLDNESGQTIISGMGELHLDIYTERMRREYDCPVITGKPYVAYRETCGKKTNFDYLHKKQSGGSGQYARVIGYIEPIPYDGPEKFEFENQVIGNSITPNYIAACEKGFKESVIKGPLLSCPVWGVRVVLTDGATHVVDSSELAFKIACNYAFKQAFENSRPSIIEPVMSVEVQVPMEFQGSVLGSISKRRGSIVGTDSSYGFAIFNAEVPLGEMFGYATELRSLTQGKGEYSMEYLCHRPVTNDIAQKILKEYEKEKAGSAASASKK